MSEFLQQLVNGITQGSVYALIALGYTMVYGIIELINFAHGDVFMLGLFISLAWFTLLGVTGAITFDADRNPVKPAVVIKVENGVEKFAASIAP